MLFVRAIMYIASNFEKNELRAIEERVLKPEEDTYTILKPSTPMYKDKFLYYSNVNRS